MRSASHTISLAGTLIWFLCSCAATPELSSAADDEVAKRFSPPAGKAALYIYRKDGFRGSAVRFPVTVDGRLLGAIANGTYYMLEVDPGEHEVWIGWDQEMPRTINDPIAAKLVLLPVSAVASGVYFFRAGQGDQQHVAVPHHQGKDELLACCKLAPPRSAQQTIFR